MTATRNSISINNNSTIVNTNDNSPSDRGQSVAHRNVLLRMKIFGGSNPTASSLVDRSECISRACTACPGWVSEIAALGICQYNIAVHNIHRTTPHAFMYDDI
jgi:hypothetical protein